MSQNNQEGLKKKGPHIFVVGNEKGGAGKTTFSMHLIIGLLDRGYKIASLDTDSRQKSLTSYIDNRKEYNKKNPDKRVPMPLHFHMPESASDTIKDKEEQERKVFEQVLEQARTHADFIIIDTPGSHTNLSRIAHSFADTVITPVNDSFIDLDVMAKIEGEKLQMDKPSIYSEMVWQQKMTKAQRDQGQMNWVVVRNRLSNLDAQNKRNVHDALDQMSKRLAFKVAPGLSERVIYRELFPTGLTLLDLTRANFNKSFSISHVAARQELKNFLDFLEV